MKQKDVEGIFGKPDKNFKDDDQNVIYVYNQDKLRLTFYEDEDFKLGYLISSNPDLVLLDQKIIGAKPSEIKEVLISKGFKTWEQEDFDMTENHFNEANWIILQSEFGQIIKVELGAVINSKDELDWKF
ncbi:hypothetical protein FNO01nite_20270 [Flavobacterium noncentrifugens]|nr:hypothetical protein FNO01nite_20270 [Flavobacterium noncentrifugens]